MKKILSLLTNGSTTAHGAYLKLRADIEASTGKHSHYAVELGNEFASALDSANAAFLTNPSLENMEAYYRAFDDSKKWSFYGLASHFTQSEQNTLDAVKRSPASLKIVRAALSERGENIQATINKIRSTLDEKLGELGLANNSDEHPSLVSLRGQLQAVVDAIALIDYERTPTSAQIQSLYTLLDTPLAITPVAAPMPLEERGMLSYGIRELNSRPAFIPAKTLEEQIAETNAPYIGTPIPASELEDVPGMGLVRRRQPAPPIMLEPIVGKDGKLVMGLSEHQHA